MTQPAGEPARPPPQPTVRTRCAICDTDAHDAELYPESLAAADLTYQRFSARRTPDRVHCRMVRCRRCGLVRANPILSADELGRLYAGSLFTYAAESAYTRATYVQQLRTVLPLLAHRGRLLEVGCGNGFFLEEALAAGFAEVVGVEPSRDSVARAPAGVRGYIVNDVLHEGLFPPEHFDLVCGFQVLDHLASPNAVLQTCYRLLRPGGLALFVNHDVGAWTNRLLGRRSPIVDVQHVYLYDRRTMARLFVRNGFAVVRSFAVANVYPLRYWLKMAPLPLALKDRLLPLAERSWLGGLPLPLWAGNQGIVARRPLAV